MDVTKALSFITALLLALCAFFEEGLSITCYMCNSATSRNGKPCATLEGNKALFEQNCDHLAEARHDNVTYTVCRKIVQTIIDTDGNEETRVIRQCGRDSPLGCSWRTRPNTLQVQTCHCNNEDLCNTADSVNKPSVIGYLAVGVSVLLYQTLNNLL